MRLSRSNIIGLMIGFCSLVAAWLAVRSGAREWSGLLVIPACLVYFWWMFKPHPPKTDE